MAYKEFSYFYDYFNYNADYDRLFHFIESEIALLGVKKGSIVCDLGCGTGELSFRFVDKGFDVIAIDNSEDMLNVIYDKKYEKGYDSLLILNQDITKLDLYGTVDVFTCTFDTVNHLHSKKDVQTLFDKVSLFMHPEGIFFFDMNTEYKHENILKNEEFIFDEEQAKCIWKNSLDKINKNTKISISIFDKENNVEFNEEFFENYYSFKEIEELLKNSKLKIIKTIDGEVFEGISPTSQRALFVVKKEI